MARKKRQVILPPTYVGAQPSRPGSSAPGGSVANHVGPILDGFKVAAASAMKIADDAARGFYQESLSALSNLLEQQVFAVRTELGSAQRSHIESLQADIAARSILMERKAVDVGQQQALANSYYGSSPFGKNADYYAGATFQNIATGRIKVSDIQEALNIAYRAAYTVKLREAEIQMLQAQIAALQQALHAAREQLRAEAEAEAQARARQEAEAKAREQERQLAEAEAQRARDLAAIRAANTYNLELSTAVAPRVVAALGAAGQLVADITPTRAISAAIAELKNARVGGLIGPLGVGIVALLYPSELGDGELPANYLLSTSLTDLGIDLGSEGQASALARGMIDLPVRLGSQSEEGSRDDLFVARTDTTGSSAVRVLAATFNIENGSYSVTTEDTPPRTLVWTPATTPESSSTTSPATPPSATTYVGPTLEPLEGRLDSFPELEDTGFDDYVIIFPADSGLPPLYVMFKSRRYMPGTVSGEGKVIEGGLLKEGNEQGVAIPAQVARSMRGMAFRNFGQFRTAFWKALANSSDFTSNFDDRSLALMKSGYAPWALKHERAGGRVKYEIHHVKRIADGGEVYDVDNMVIIAPRYHVELHRKSGK